MSEYAEVIVLMSCSAQYWQKYQYNSGINSKVLINSKRSNKFRRIFFFHSYISFSCSWFSILLTQIRKTFLERYKKRYYGTNSYKNREIYFRTRFVYQICPSWKMRFIKTSNFKRNMKSTSRNCFLPSCFCSTNLLLPTLEPFSCRITPDLNPKIAFEVNLRPILTIP